MDYQEMLDRINMTLMQTDLYHKVEELNNTLNDLKNIIFIKDMEINNLKLEIVGLREQINKGVNNEN